MILSGIRRVVNLGKQRPILQSFVRHKAAYDGEGKTTVHILNQNTELGLMIVSYATFGFRLNNGISIVGPMAIFPRTVMSWQVGGAHEITPESLKLFTILEPKIDLLVMGLETQERPMLDRVLRMAKSLGLNTEIMSTEHACSTFNFLNAEGRSVAAALVPPLSVTLMDDDMLHSKIHYGNMFNKEMY